MDGPRTSKKGYLVAKGGKPHLTPFLHLQRGRDELHSSFSDKNKLKEKKKWTLTGEGTEKCFLLKTTKVHGKKKILPKGPFRTGGEENVSNLGRKDKKPVKELRSWVGEQFRRAT